MCSLSQFDALYPPTLYHLYCLPACHTCHTQALLLHPCTSSETITENELALFGSVTAEVDRWYKRQELPLGRNRGLHDAMESLPRLRPLTISHTRIIWTRPSAKPPA